jgi:hypothetical protein
MAGGLESGDCVRMCVCVCVCVCGREEDRIRNMSKHTHSRQKLAPTERPEIGEGKDGDQGAANPAQIFRVPLRKGSERGACCNITTCLARCRCFVCRSLSSSCQKGKTVSGQLTLCLCLCLPICPHAPVDPLVRQTRKERFDQRLPDT